MRTLIIPDAHLKWRKVERILADEPHDQAVFLSDMFDDYGDSPIANHEMAGKVAEWIRRGYTFVWGNHDMMYAFGGRFPVLRSGGWSPRKQAAIGSVLDSSDWNHFQLHAWVDGWLVSHGGLHPCFLTSLPAGKDKREYIDEELRTATRCLLGGRHHPLWLPGEDRYGTGEAPQRIGGITWMDWRSFREPIHGINQLCGHTFNREVRTLITSDSLNYCIDTGLRHYAVITDGVLEIKAYAALFKEKARAC
jgi:hypothetical protein